jgi:hypothetical protein
MMSIMDPNAVVRALSKLLDYTASGIGAVAGPMLAPWQARREAAALRITAEGQADALRSIAAAQSDARDALASTSSNFQAEIDMAETVRQRIQFQEEKRHGNIGSVVGQTAELLGDKEVPDQEPDHDWTARFFNYIQDVSSKEMQLLWAKVLAGEVEQPGSVSIRALSILRNMDRSSAELFRTLCSVCMTHAPAGGRVSDAIVPSLCRNAGENSLEKFGLPFGKLNILNEHGLIIGDYNSWFDMKMCVGIPVAGFVPNVPVCRAYRAAFGFQGRHWVLVPADQIVTGAELRIHGVTLTQAGKELSKIIECVAMPEYRQALVDFFTSQNLMMTEVNSPNAHIIDAGPG